MTAGALLREAEATSQALARDVAAAIPDARKVTAAVLALHDEMSRAARSAAAAIRQLEASVPGAISSAGLHGAHGLRARPSPTHILSRTRGTSTNGEL